MGNMINIGGRIHNPEVGNVVAGANEILDDTKGKKQNVINQETDAALLNLSQTKQDNLTFDNAPTENSNNPVKSGGVYAADAALQSAIEAILLLIPSAASSLNQLADKAFVNSSISTNTATFRGTYNSVSDLHLAIDATHAQIEAALDSTIATADNNDYCYVQIPVSATSFDIEKTERYKFDGTGWKFEYQLNNSGFTSAQWAAINSGITSALVGDINFIKTVVPAEATALNQLADKAYVIAQILAATPAFKGQFTTLADLQAVASPKAGDLGIVRTKDSDGYDVFTFYQYLNNAWNVFYTLSHHLLRKPASTGTTGDYPYNGMGRVVLEKNMVNVGTSENPDYVNQLTQDMFYKGEVGSRVPNTDTIFVIQYDFVLAEDITIPANCVLEFDGGSIKNASGNSYEVTGTKTKINTDVAYNIFNDTLGGGFELPFIDLRWVGGVSDYDEDAKTGTDNAFAFTRALNLIGQYYNGMHIHLVGQYVISTTVSTIYDLNIFGEHFNSRIYGVGDPQSDTTSPSLIAVNCTDAFVLEGRGDADFAHFNIKNIKVIGTVNYTQNFLKVEANGAPGRVAIVEECEFTHLDKCIYAPIPTVHPDWPTVADVTLEKNIAYLCNCFVNLAGSTNLKIKDSNIEGCGGNGYHAIELHNAGITVIDNNILESNEDCIYIRSGYSPISITNNYFEFPQASPYNGFLIDISTTDSSRWSPVNIYNNTYAAKKLKVSLSNVTFGLIEASTISEDSEIIGCRFEQYSDELPQTAIKEFALIKRVGEKLLSLSDYDCRAGLYQNFIVGDFTNSFATRQTFTTTKANQLVFVGLYNPQDTNLQFELQVVLQGVGTIIYDTTRNLTHDYVTIYPLVISDAGDYSLKLKRISPANPNTLEVSPPFVITDGLSSEKIVFPTLATRFSIYNRPNYLPKPAGWSYFDVGLGKELWWDGTNWKDGAGNVIS